LQDTVWGTLNLNERRLSTTGQASILIVEIEEVLQDKSSDTQLNGTRPVVGRQTFSAYVIFTHIHELTTQVPIAVLMMLFIR